MPTAWAAGATSAATAIIAAGNRQTDPREPPAMDATNTLATRSASAAAIQAARPRAVNGRARLALALAVLAFGLGGCTARLIYDRLDTLIAWYVEDRLELAGGQQQELRRLIGAQLEWHRETQLPLYADAFATLQRDAARPLGRARLDRALVEADAFWAATMRNVAPEAARFIAGLDEAQVEGLFREFAEDDAERRRKFARDSPEERLERRTKRAIRSIERWTGRLDAAQRARVAQATAAAEPLDEAWLDNRARWRAEFRAALARRADAGAFAREVERLFVEPESAWTAEYRAATQRNRERYVTLVADLDATLSPQQRERVRSQLATWAADLRALTVG
ncbi:MAG: DUF6279 family lipoprotein [Pseudomonadota bacterium]